MALILKGKPVADQLILEMGRIVNEAKAGGTCPKLSVLRVGNREDDLSYESRLLKNCAEIGIETNVIVVDRNSITEILLEHIDRLNADNSVHGILLFRPLPEQFDLDRISRRISLDKDIDCMNPLNQNKVFLGDSTAIAPCTPEAVIALLHHYGINLAGKHVVVVNRSMVLGKPLAMLLLSENATVTICHSKTQNLEMITAQADIVVTGVGKAGFFQPYHFSETSIVIDAGINYQNDKLCGDVEFETVSELVQAITPVPGGIGTITSMILLRHVLHGLS